MLARRAKEVAAMLIVGDGLLSLLFPRRHVLLWTFGPRAYREAMEKFVAHPNATRAVALAEIALGAWLGRQQETR